MSPVKALLIRLGIPLAVISATVVAMPASHCEKEKDFKGGAAASVQIHASQSAVWTAMTDAEQFDTTIQSESADGVVVEQRFVRLPFFGQLAVTFRITTVPQESLNFSMLRSNCLKAFSGTFLVIPINDHETEVEMHSFVDPALPVPQFLVNQFISGKLHKRLLKVKKLAESPRLDAR
jgi:hypothetical protein